MPRGAFTLCLAAVGGLVFVGPGCYQPSVPACVVECASGSECPEGTNCTMGFCNPPGVSGASCVGTVDDADPNEPDAGRIELDDAGRPTVEMIEIPGGPFTMGCAGAPDDLDCFNDEDNHTVTVSTFEIDRTETTQEAYALCVADGACAAPSESIDEWAPDDEPNWPALGLDHAMAADYCEWLGKRLPTEAEWEKAARGAADERVYPWGNASPECGTHGAWAIPGCTQVPRDVGSYPAGASPYGALDMAGNVWEWVSDWYVADYAALPAEDPTGPGSGTERILRGGGWRTGEARFLRVSNRNNTPPGGVDNTYGVRCAR